MKWVLPKDNDRRIVKRFAWLPKLIHVDPGEPRIKIWLETYYSYEKASWDGNYYAQFNLTRCDKGWIKDGVLTSKTDRLKNKLGVK